MTSINQLILLVQREIKLAGMRGDTKHLRYLRTALHNLMAYKTKTTEQTNEGH